MTPTVWKWRVIIFHGHCKDHTVLLRSRTMVLFRTTLSFWGQKPTVLFRTKQPLMRLWWSQPATLRIGDSEGRLSIISVSAFRVWVKLCYFLVCFIYMFGETNIPQPVWMTNRKRPILFSSPPLFLCINNDNINSLLYETKTKYIFMLSICSTFRKYILLVLY